MLDVVVIGAGSAGAHVALAFAQAGRSVALIDKRPRGKTGARWVNMVPRRLFDQARLPAPGPSELVHVRAGTFVMIPPGGEHTVRGKSDGRFLHVDMRRLIDRLLGAASDRGVELRQAQLTRVFEERGRVSGVEIEERGRRETLRARLVVDASGIGGAVRARVTARAWPAPAPEDRCLAAEFQFRVKDAGALSRLLARYGAEPGDDLAFTSTHGGYSTLTFFTTHDLQQVGVLAGSIPAMGAISGARMVEQTRLEHPFIGEPMFGGRGAIPLRLPYAELSQAGLALVGDAACQVYASHGSGVGIGLVAGRVLADAVAHTDDPGDPRALCRYDHMFHRQHGGLLAASDAFRRYSQRLLPEHTAELVASGLIDPEMFLRVMEQRPNRPSPHELARIARGVRRSPRVAARFAPMAARSLLLDRFGPWLSRPRLRGALEWLVGPTPPPVAQHTSDEPDEPDEHHTRVGPSPS